MVYNVLVSTTSSVPNMTIFKHIDLVSANVVIGTNIFSDIAATFTDFFGGKSATYQGKLQEIYKEVIDELKSRAATIGANAIIGLKIDFDEISGGGKSMFMISAVGTAVHVVSCNSSLDQVYESEKSCISSTTLANEITKNRIIQLLKQGIFPTEEYWQYMLNYPNDETTILLLDVLWRGQDKFDYNVTITDQLKDNILNYLKRVDSLFAITILYPKIIDIKCRKITFKILKDNNLFSPKHVIDLIQNNELSAAIYCLELDKVTYTMDDLAQMVEISDMLGNIPNTGETLVVKSGLLSKEKTRYICENGHTNSITSEYCDSLSCLKNIKGLTKIEVSKIDDFRVKVDSLKSLFASQSN